MQIVEKVEINFYRSLKKVVIKDITDLNIFSGKNDTGKSNILNALNLFFSETNCDFILDYNKERLGEVRKSIKGKQFISITVHFTKPEGYKTLPDKFKITRKWDRTGNMYENKDNLDILAKTNGVPSTLAKAKRTLTGFLNKIKFIHVPAIRDSVFFSKLLLELQQALFEAEARKIKSSYHDEITDYKEKLNKAINKITKELNNNFYKITNIKTDLRLPDELADLFQRLIINTELGEHFVPMERRGFGIKMRYIPTVLDFISKYSNCRIIWGYDEPENSCEYLLSSQMANNFKEKYSRTSQIFLTTHSFSFVNIEGENVAQYRIFFKDDELNSSIMDLRKKNDQLLLEEELGIIEINKEFAERLESWKKERSDYEKLITEMRKKQKPVLIFEGSYDVEHFKLAYKNLYNEDIDKKFLINKPNLGSGGSDIGGGAEYLNEFLRNYVCRIHNPNIPIIAIFDFDTTGYTQFKGLTKGPNGIFKTSDIDPNNKNILVHTRFNNVFAILLVEPDFRNDFVKQDNPDHCKLTTELLYKNDLIDDPNKNYPSPNDKSFFSFKGVKSSFFNKVKNIAKSNFVDFIGFKPTFELIKQIIKILNN